MSQGLNLKIADIVFSILPTGNIRRFSVENSHNLFKTDEEPDIVLKVKRGIPPDTIHIEDRFITPIWTYSRFNGSGVFRVLSSDRNKPPERTLILKSGLKESEIILSKVIKTKGKLLQNPFAYPLDQLLMIDLLHRKHGILVHSCGFAYRNKGYLFIGSSGAGKSTLAQILGKDKGVLILSDDRIVVRKKDECFYIHGTPWHGTAGIVSPEKAPLRGLFFLKKDEGNLLQRLSIPDTVSRLIKCSFPPFWDKVGMASTLKICEDIATSIPCFEFSFLPDNTAFEMIKERFLIS
jgi:hypothetical protein